MNADAKTETLSFRVSREVKARLQARANDVAGGKMTVVIDRLLMQAMRHWNKKRPPSQNDDRRTTEKVSSR